MSQNGERNGDCHTENTDYSYTLDRQDTSQLPNINKIIQSTEQIINSQAIKIFQLMNEIKTLKRENESLKAKYQTIVKAKNGNSGMSIDTFASKIHELEVQLISTKTQLALLKEQSLEMQFANMKNSRNFRNTYSEKREEIVGFPEIEKMVNSLVNKIGNAENDTNKQQWLKSIDIFLTSYPRIDKFKEKTYQLVKKGIPSQLRERLWPIVFTNKLGITSTLYGELLNRIKKDESYSKKVLTQINKDIVRSFNGKTQFDQKIGLVSEVTELLEVFHVFRPDVSYVQGMTYPAIVLTLIVGKNKGFEIFCNLMLSNQFFRRLYTFESNYLTCYCRAFDLLLQEKQPKLAKILQQRNIQSQIYLVEWFYTFFSRGLSYEFTLKIWDFLAYQQQLLFFKLGLSIFEMLEEPIMKSNYEEPITIIRQFGNHVNESKLLQLYIGQKLNEEKMVRVFDKIFKKDCVTK